MPRELTDIPDEAAALNTMIRERSQEAPVLVMKFSPICPISEAAEERVRAWLVSLPEDHSLQTIEFDVIEQRPLVRSLAEEMGIRHESPQALRLKTGEVSWHASHNAITADAITEALD